MDGGEWEPETANLRDGEATDESSHAQRNLAAIREGYRELLPDVDEHVETPTQTYRVRSETTVDGRPAVRLTTPYSDQELYRLRFDEGGDGALLEYHAPADGNPGGFQHATPREWLPRSRQVSWPGYDSSDRDE